MLERCTRATSSIAVRFDRLTHEEVDSWLAPCHAHWKSSACAGHCFIPGPIWSVRDDNAAPLSWFAVPIGGNRSDTLISALDTALATSDAEGERPDVPNLMRRVVDTDALHVRRQVVALPPEWYDDASRERVVMVDERTTSFVDVCTPASERSSHFLAMVGFVANRHPDARIWLLQSADAGTGAWLSEKAPLPPGIRKLAVSHSLRDVLATANALYVTGASEGMAALFQAKPCMSSAPHTMQAGASQSITRHSLFAPASQASNPCSTRYSCAPPVTWILKRITSARLNPSCGISSCNMRLPRASPTSVMSRASPFNGGSAPLQRLTSPPGAARCAGFRSPAKLDATNKQQYGVAICRQVAP